MFFYINLIIHECHKENIYDIQLHWSAFSFIQQLFSTFGKLSNWLRKEVLAMILSASAHDGFGEGTVGSGAITESLRLKE